MGNRVSEFIGTRRETIKTLNELADDIDTIRKRSTKANIAGTTASIVGAVVGIPLSIAAIVVTGGAAAPLAIIAIGGSLVGGAGGLTSFGAGVGKHFHVKSKYIKAVEAVKKDKKFCKAVLGDFTIFKRSVSAVGVAATGVKYGAKIARIVLKNSDAMNVACKVIKISGRISIAASIILLPVDIYTLVVNIKDLSSDKRHEKAENIREWARELKNQLSELEESMNAD